MTETYTTDVTVGSPEGSQRVYGTLGGDCIIQLHRFALIYGSLSDTPPSETSFPTYFGDDTTIAHIKQCGYKYNGYLSILWTISGDTLPIAVAEIRICKKNANRIIIETYGLKIPSVDISLWFNSGTTSIPNWIKLNNTSSTYLMPYLTQTLKFTEKKQSNTVNIVYCKTCPDTIKCISCDIADRFYCISKTGNEHYPDLPAFCYPGNQYKDPYYNRFPNTRISGDGTLYDSEYPYYMASPSNRAYVYDLNYGYNGYQSNTLLFNVTNFYYEYVFPVSLIWHGLTVYAVVYQLRWINPESQGMVGFLFVDDNGGTILGDTTTSTEVHYIDDLGIDHTIEFFEGASRVYNYPNIAVEYTIKCSKVNITTHKITEYNGTTIPTYKLIFTRGYTSAYGGSYAYSILNFYIDEYDNICMEYRKYVAGTEWNVIVMKTDGYSTWYKQKYETTDNWYIEHLSCFNY